MSGIRTDYTTSLRNPDPVRYCGRHPPRIRTHLTRRIEMKTRNLFTAACLLAVGCDMESAALPEADGSVTLEITVNADGTMTQKDNGVTAAIEAGNPIRILARGVDGEVLYDVTGADIADVSREIRGVLRSIPPGDIAAAFEVMSPEALKATRDMLKAMPSPDEVLAMSPEERVKARAAFEAARMRGLEVMRAEPLRGNK